MSYKTQTNELMTQYKLNLLHYSFIVTTIIYIVGTIIGTLYSLRSNETILNLLLFHFIFFLIAMAILMFARYTKRGLKYQYAAYFFVAIALSNITLFLNHDLHIANSIGISFALFFTIFFMHQIKAIVIYWIPFLGATLYYWITSPITTITLGHGYYISIIFSVGLVIFLVYKGIRLNLWYEQQLIKELETVSQQNTELTAYNEEFQATQDELFANYDKITVLNQELETSLKEMDYLAHYDQLTGVANRLTLSNQMNQLMEQGEGLTFAILDLKNLKYINTTFGFQAGDHILQYLGKSLPAVLDSLTLHGRIGGDEFGLVFSQPIDAKTLLRTLNDYYHQFHTDYFTFTLAFYLGLSQSEPGDQAIDLIKKADIALHKAKNNTKDIAYYTPDYIVESENHLHISSRLEQAIDLEEISLVFQPKVESHSQNIIGFETLVRWNSSDLGFIAPPIFIGLAEKTGFITPLSLYIIEHACRFIKKALPLNPNLVVSINISGIQLLEDSFIEDLVGIVRKHELPYSSIGLEVTETSIIEELTQAKEVLKTLKELGFKIYLDDFGTGYSSLNYLRRLPIDYLKIDKSFIDDITHDEHSLAMVSTIIALAKNFHLKLVAEGVEDTEQFHLLLNYDCDIIQGYFFDRPLPEAEALDRLKEGPYQRD